MRWLGKSAVFAAMSAGLAGCIVVPARRHVYVGPVVPAPVVVETAPPPGVVEVVPDAPGPDYVWVPGVYYYDSYGYRRWHRGYYHRR